MHHMVHLLILFSMGLSQEGGSLLSALCPVFLSSPCLEQGLVWALGAPGGGALGMLGERSLSLGRMWPPPTPSHTGLLSVLLSQGLSVFHYLPASHPSLDPLRSAPFSTMGARRVVKRLDLIMSSAFLSSWMAALDPKANDPIPYLT